VTLVTTVQQTMTALKTVETEDKRFTIVVKAVFELVMRN
jgi:hypothetical protein